MSQDVGAAVVGSLAKELRSVQFALLEQAPSPAQVLGGQLDKEQETMKRRRRKLKQAVELWSDIGAATVDLHDGHGAEASQRALTFLRAVNPEAFAVLRDWLNAEDLTLGQK